MAAPGLPSRKSECGVLGIVCMVTLPHKEAGSGALFQISALPLAPRPIEIPVSYCISASFSMKRKLYHLHHKVLGGSNEIKHMKAF